MKASAATSELTSRLLDDACQLLHVHGPSIATSPQHVWKSVLHFAPLNVELRRKYYHLANTGIKVVQGVDSDWQSRPAEGHSSYVTLIACSPDGTRLASGSRDNTVRLWDAASGDCTATLTGHSHWVTSIAFSPIGNRLASAADDETARLWDPTTGTCTAILTGHSTAITPATFSPNGRHLASGSSNNTLRLWEPRTGMCTAILIGHSGRVASVTFASNGSSLASGSWDNSVRLWDPMKGVCTERLLGHTGWVVSVAFSPDGSHLASASLDKTVRLWDRSTGSCVATWAGHSLWITSVTFSLDGTHLQTEYQNSAPKFWNALTGTHAKFEDWSWSCKRSGNFGSMFTQRGSRLYWEGHYGPESLVCFLPHEAGARCSTSGELNEGVDVVAVGCATGRVIILHIQLPLSPFQPHVYE